jgi:hypothetical protein
MTDTQTLIAVILAISLSPFVVSGLVLARLAYVDSRRGDGEYS